tara:strand:+ start:1627 stop:3069 length:1443 start_codon:yes stop_codon:yes gene_type:complete
MSSSKKYITKQQETNKIGTVILGTIKKIQDNTELTLLQKEKQLKEIKQAFKDNIKRSDTLYFPITMALVNAFKKLKEKETKKVNKIEKKLMNMSMETKPSGELFLPEGISLNKDKIEKELMNASPKSTSRSELLLPYPGAFTVSTDKFAMTPQQQAVVDKEEKAQKAKQKAKRKGGRRKKKTRKKSRRRRGKGKITDTKKKAYKKYSKTEKGKKARREAMRALRERERKKNELRIQKRMVNKPKQLERVKSYDELPTEGKWYENYGSPVGFTEQAELDFTEGALNRLKQKRERRKQERKKREGLPVLKPLKEGDSKLTDEEMTDLLKGVNFMDIEKTRKKTGGNRYGFRDKAGLLQLIIREIGEENRGGIFQTKINGVNDDESNNNDIYIKKEDINNIGSDDVHIPVYTVDMFGNPTNDLHTLPINVLMIKYYLIRKKDGVWLSKIDSRSGGRRTRRKSKRKRSKTRRKSKRKRRRTRRK